MTSYHLKTMHEFEDFLYDKLCVRHLCNIQIVWRNLKYLQLWKLINEQMAIVFADDCIQIADENLM